MMLFLLNKSDVLWVLEKNVKRLDIRRISVFFALYENTLPLFLTLLFCVNHSSLKGEKTAVYL
jgi:hypothetical protein